MDRRRRHLDVCFDRSRRFVSVRKAAEHKGRANYLQLPIETGAVDADDGGNSFPAHSCTVFTSQSFIIAPQLLRQRRRRLRCLTELIRRSSGRHFLVWEHATNMGAKRID